MNARRARDLQYRRVVATGFLVSVAIHGAVLGLSTFTVAAPESPGEEPREEATQSEFQVAALELITLEKAAAPTAEPVVQRAQAASRPVETEQAAAPSPRDLLQRQIALSMRPDFTTQRAVSDWSLQPIQFAGDLDGGDLDDEDDHAGHDHSGGRSWWEGLGNAIGIGGGGHCPVDERAAPVVRR